MDRRGFLKALTGGLAATAALAAVDPEYLLWRPGAKTIFLPTERAVANYTIQVRLPQRFIVRSGEPFQAHLIDLLSFDNQGAADAFTRQWEIDNNHPGFFGPSKSEIYASVARERMRAFGVAH